MKTLQTLFFVGLIMWVSEIMAQENWEIIESPTVQDLTSITFFTPEIGIITARGETLLRTEDGGLNWVMVLAPPGSNQGPTSPPVERLIKDYNSSKSNTTSAPPGDGLLLGDLGFIARTTNSGLDWTTSGSGTMVNLFGADFLDSNTVIAVGDSGTVLKSIDGGNNFVKIQGVPATERLNTVVFFDENTGVIFGNGETALRSTDAGSSWTTFTIDTTGMATFTTDEFLIKDYNSSKSNTTSISTGDGIMLGDLGFIALSSNSGLDWTTSGSGTNSNLFGVDYYDSTTIVVAGAGGTAAISYDGGNNFQLVDGIPTTVDLTDVFFTDDTTGIIVGNSGVILRTPEADIVVMVPDTLSDPGDTVAMPITMTGTQGVDILSFQFDLLFTGTMLEPDTAYIDGTTLPGQVGWLFEFEASNNVLTLVAAGADPLGPEGILLYAVFNVAEDAQNNDSSPITFANFLFNAGNPAPSQLIDGSVTVVVAGGDVDSNGTVQAFDASMVLQYLVGYIELSLWQQLEADVSDNDQITELDASLILQYVAGTIVCFPSQCPITAPLANGDLSIPETVVATGEEVVIPIFITDAEKVFSASFEVVYDSEVLQLTEIRTTPATEGFMTAHNAIDGEAHIFLAGAFEVEGDHEIVEVVFTRLSQQAQQTLVILASARLNENLIWSDGDTTIVDLLVSVTDEPQFPTRFALYQNHPNPFNPTTTIQYEIPVAGFVALQIFDVLGNKIATLVNEEKPIGSYKVEFNTTGLPSGVYFYRLQAGNPSTGSGQGFVETKKMVLLR